MKPDHDHDHKVHHDRLRRYFGDGRSFIVDTPGVVVVIRNLGIVGPAATGFDFRSGATLIVENCVSRNQLGFGI